MNKIAILLVTLFTSGAYAGERASTTFNNLDADQDGKVSVQEASEDPRLSAMWSEIDSDSSGAIDQAEFSAFETMEKSEGDAQ